jgi:hypothetical protein
MNILAIDNGNISSAFVVWNGSEILNKGILLNHDLLEFVYCQKLRRLRYRKNTVVWDACRRKYF